MKASERSDKKERTIIYYDKTHLKWIVQQELALFSLIKQSQMIINNKQPITYSSK